MNDMARTNVPSDVFRYIDTHGNDPEPCWEWTGHLGGRDGRGYITIDGRRQLAYRVVYEIFNGPLEPGMKVRHTCDNPQCCNPEHLIKGTQGDNETDKYVRDRAGYTHDMIKEIRRLDKMSMTYREIAAHVGHKFKCKVSYSGVGKVLRGERRKKG